MDMLFVVVLVILAGFGLHGYLRGLVRVLFSLVAIFLTIGLATALAPHTADFLKNSTSLDQVIQEKCTEYIQENAAKTIHQKGQEENKQNDDKVTIFGMEVPSEIRDFLGANMVKQANGLLEESGTYEKLGEFVAEQILQRAAWALSFFIVFVILFILVHVLDLFSKLPVLSSINRLGGLAIGLVQGLLVVWLLFLLVVLCQGSEWGRQMMDTIDHNIFLKFLYENNIIEEFINGIMI